MGAGASALPVDGETFDKAAVQGIAGDKFDEAAFDKAATDGAVSRAVLQEAWRREFLEEIFRACDDDKSGALSYNEFNQIFSGVDETTKGNFGSILFGQADGDGDGKLNIDEFVVLHLKKFGGSSDADFVTCCGKLLEVAKQRVVIDKEAATVEGYAADTKSGTTEAPAVKPLNLDTGSKRFVSYATWPPTSPRFLSCEPKVTLSAPSFAPPSAAPVKTEEAAAAAPEWKTESLLGIFKACDKDSSGALSMSEFTAIFDKIDETSKAQFGGILLAQADTDGDGKVSSDEWVALQIKKFGSLSDDDFKAVCEKMLAAATNAASA